MLRQIMSYQDFVVPTLLPFITAALVTYFAIPALITIAKVKKLHDEPNYRKPHTESTPTLGGIAIFAGILISYTFWSGIEEFKFFKYSLISIILLFFVAIKDDIIGLDVNIKIFTQILATVIIILLGDIRITSLNGLFGIYELPYWISFTVTAFESPIGFSQTT